MTCIVALRTVTSIAIAGDGMTSAGDWISGRSTKKYIELPGGWIVANSGLTSFRELLAVGEKNLSLDGDVYALCSSIRAYLKEVGFSSKPQDRCGLSLYDLGVVIVNRGSPRVIVRYPDEVVARDEKNPGANPPGIWVCAEDIWPRELGLYRPYGTGSGGSLGEGAAWAALKAGWGALSSVRTGVEAAIEYDLNSGGEIWSMEIAL